MFKKKNSRGDALFYKAMTHFNEQRWLETVETIEKAIPKHIKNYDMGMVYAILGYSLTKLNRKEEAIEAHKKSVELSPEHLVGWRYYGITLRVAGDFDGAEECYERALSIDPNDELTITSLVALYIFRNKPQKAIEIMEPMDLDKIENALTFSNYALALGQVGRFKDAEEALAKSVSLGYPRWREVQKRINDIRTFHESLNVQDTSWLPERCTQCGAALGNDTVQWMSQSTVQCGYCGSVHRK